MVSMHSYKGYKLTVRGDEKPTVSVFDSRRPCDPAVYRASSLDKAMRWVDGYCDGAVWAMQEKEHQTSAE